MTGTTKRLLLASIVLGSLGFAACSDDGDGGGGEGGTAGEAGAVTTGGKTGAGGAKTGGTTAKAGASSTGGAGTTGGATTGNGGATGTVTGGATGTVTGGAGTTGGATSTVAACGTTTSTYSEDAQFTATAMPARWALNTGSSAAGTTLVAGTASPVANATLCAGGCAVLTLTIPAGTAAWSGGAIVNEWLASPETNLYGAKVTAKVAVEIVSGSASTLSLAAFSQGGSTTNYAWGTTSSGTMATLTDVSSFHDIVLNPINGTGTSTYCASKTGALGLQIQPSAAITAATVVKVYIKSVVVGTPSTGTGGASGTGGSSSTGGAVGTGGATDAGGSTAVGGATAAGGSTEVGGATAAGGSTEVGGATGTGGSTEVGGATAAGGTTAATTTGPTTVQAWNYTSTVESWASTTATVAFDNSSSYCTASGCLSTTATLTSTADNGATANTSISLASPLDLAGATITIKVSCTAASKFDWIQIFTTDSEPWSASDGNWFSAGGNYNGAAALCTASGVTLTATLPATKVATSGSVSGGYASAGFNPALINVIGIQVGVNKASTNNGSSTFLVDSVTITK